MGSIRETMKMKNKKGFTLVEVLVVIVIVGVLAGIAMPVYTSQVKRSYRVEALSQLTAIRSAMADFFTMNNKYTGADFGTPLSATAIGYENPATQATNTGQTAHFTYGISVGSATTYTITATGVAVSPLATTDTVIIKETGAITGTLT